MSSLISWSIILSTTVQRERFGYSACSAQIQHLPPVQVYVLCSRRFVSCLLIHLKKSDRRLTVDQLLLVLLTNGSDTWIEHSNHNSNMPIKKTARTFDQEQIADFKEAFDIFDHDGNGSISLSELRLAMQKLGQYPSDAELKVMIKRVDVNHDGSIDFNEFVQLMSLVSPSNPEKELWDAFNRIDADGSGYIDKDELKALMKSLGQKLTEEEIREMMKEVDSNGDGKIRFVTSPCIENYPITISLI